MPTLYGEYETPPGLARHRWLWLALFDALLPVTEVRDYHRKLMSLIASFLAVKTIPTWEGFHAITCDLHELLRDAAYNDAGRNIDDGRLARAAACLRRAAAIAEGELVRDGP